MELRCDHTQILNKTCLQCNIYKPACNTKVWGYGW